MTEIEKLRKEQNDRLDAFENKPKCEIGNWHWTEPGSLYFIEKINGNICFGYGLSYNNNWSIGFVCYIENIKRITTDVEVAEMLTKEAVKRGLVKGVKFKSMCGFGVVTLNTNNYALHINAFLCDYKYLMQNGIWAVPIKEKTIEEWGEEFREFFTRQGHKTFAQDFCEFITKHNFKLPT